MNAMFFGALRQGLSALLTFVALILLLQGMLRAAPGDPIDLLPEGNENREALSHAMRLDRNLGEVLIDTLQGDLGESLTLRPGTPVVTLVVEAASTSAPLFILALFSSLLIGLALSLSARARTIGALFSATPAFLLAFGLVSALNGLTFAALQRGWIDRPHWFALPDQDSPFRTSLAVFVLAIASGNVGSVSAAFAAEIARARQSPWMEALRARGESVTLPLLANLLPAGLSIAGSRAVYLVGGLVVTEKLLLIQGAGNLLWESCLRRDYPLALGLGLAAGATVLGLRWLADSARLAADPRLRGAS